MGQEEKRKWIWHGHRDAPQLFNVRGIGGAGAHQRRRESPDYAREFSDG
jgi:hypothetical protein